MTSREQLAEQAAWEWAKAVQASDAPAMWRWSSASLRLVLAQLWLGLDGGTLHEAGSGRDALARELADTTPAGAVQRACMRASALTMRSAFGGYADADLAVSGHARPVEPGLMQVRLSERRGQAESPPEPGKEASALLVLCTTGDEGWRAAGIGDRLLVPGWPPVQRPVGLGADQRSSSRRPPPPS